MKTFDRGQAQRIRNTYEKGICTSRTLTDLFTFFNLSTEDDGDTVFDLLRNNVYYYGNLARENYQPSLWFVNFEGFKRLWTYAEAKEKLLQRFYLDYSKNYFEKQENSNA